MPKNPLFDYIEQGSLAQFKHCLNDRNTRVNLADEKTGDTPLIRVCQIIAKKQAGTEKDRQPYYDMMRMLIDAGADLLWKNFAGETVLILLIKIILDQNSAVTAEVRLAEELCEDGADYQLENIKKKLDNKHYESAKNLIEHKISKTDGAVKTHFEELNRVFSQAQEEYKKYWGEGRGYYSNPLWAKDRNFKELCALWLRRKYYFHAQNLCRRYGISVDTFHPLLKVKDEKLYCNDQVVGLTGKEEFDKHIREIIRFVVHSQNNDRASPEIKLSDVQYKLLLNYIVPCQFQFVANGKFNEQRICEFVKLLGSANKLGKIGLSISNFDCKPETIAMLEEALSQNQKITRFAIQVRQGADEKKPYHVELIQAISKGLRAVKNREYPCDELSIESASTTDTRAVEELIQIPCARLVLNTPIAPFDLGKLMAEAKFITGFSFLDEYGMPARVQEQKAIYYGVLNNFRIQDVWPRGRTAGLRQLEVINRQDSNLFNNVFVRTISKKVQDAFEVRKNSKEWLLPLPLQALILGYVLDPQMLTLHGIVESIQSMIPETIRSNVHFAIQPTTEEERRGQPDDKKLEPAIKKSPWVIRLTSAQPQLLVYLQKRLKAFSEFAIGENDEKFSPVLQPDIGVIEPYDRKLQQQTMEIPFPLELRVGLDRVPKQEFQAERTKPLINNAQENIVDAYFKSIYQDDLDRLSSDDAADFLFAMREEKLSEAQIAKFTRLNMLETIHGIQEVSAHPAPQNRRQGDVAAAGNEEKYPDGVIEGNVFYWEKDFGSRVMAEPQGLLGLTSRNNDEKAWPITKVGFVEYAREFLLQESLNYRNKPNIVKICGSQSEVKIDVTWRDIDLVLQTLKKNPKLNKVDFPVAKHNVKEAKNFIQGLVLQQGLTSLHLVSDGKDYLPDAMAQVLRDELVVLARKTPTLVDVQLPPEFKKWKPQNEKHLEEWRANDMLDREIRANTVDVKTIHDVIELTLRSIRLSIPVEKMIIAYMLDMQAVRVINIANALGNLIPKPLRDQFKIEVIDEKDVSKHTKDVVVIPPSSKFAIHVVNMHDPEFKSFEFPLELPHYWCIDLFSITPDGFEFRRDRFMRDLIRKDIVMNKYPAEFESNSYQMARFYKMVKRMFSWDIFNELYLIDLFKKLPEIIAKKWSKLAAEGAEYTFDFNLYGIKYQWKSRYDLFAIAKSLVTDAIFQTSELKNNESVKEFQSKLDISPFLSNLEDAKAGAIHPKTLHTIKKIIFQPTLFIMLQINQAYIKELVAVIRSVNQKQPLDEKILNTAIVEIDSAPNVHAILMCLEPALRNEKTLASIYSNPEHIDDLHEAVKFALATKKESLKDRKEYKENNVLLNEKEFANFVKNAGHVKAMIEYPSKVKRAESLLSRLSLMGSEAKKEVKKDKPDPGVAAAPAPKSKQ